MTFILAANLSDRVLLASDTVVTKQVGDIREIVCYYPKLQQFSNSTPNRFVSCLFAGDLQFAKFFSKKIAGYIDDGRLPADIAQLHAALPGFLALIMPQFPGRKKLTAIFAGTVYGMPFHTINFDRVSDILGGEAGHITDATLVQAMEIASRGGGLEKLDGKILVPGSSQEIFQMEIDESKNLINISKRLGTYNILTTGSKSLNTREQHELLRYFLDKREITSEGTDLVNYMRNQFNDTIGGAVMLGVIEGNSHGGMSFIKYDVVRDPVKPSQKNWSLSVNASGIIATGPNYEKVDLLASHFDEKTEQGGLDL